MTTPPPLKERTRYEPASVEARWTDRWLGDHLFHAEPDPEREPYSIVIPPPNVTGNLHMGHALNGTIQDVLIRYHRLRGKNACWLVGTDHAGIATQNVVEKQLRKDGVTKEDLGREEFVRRVWAWREEYGGTIIEQLKRLGCACDYDRERFTFDEGYVRAVNRVFVSLYDKGYIYKDHYLVNWCPRCASAISDLEVAHQERPGALYHIRYELEDGGSIIIATTRPETMLGDTAVAVHPGDERYTDVVGRTAVLPLLGRRLPVVADERVDPEFGSGGLKITPAHDVTDFDIGRDHGLETVQAIGPDGRITEAGGPYAGLDVETARERVIEDLRAAGLLVRVDDFPHSVATCDRCHTAIEPLISLQWFMRMDELKEPATEVVRDGRVKFVPERWGRVYIDWMENLRPWCISRQLWWGHQLPVWYCDACGETLVRETGPESCPLCGGRLRRETDVLDTWFSSALWPFATWGWPEETPDLDYFYPTDVLSTAREIIFLWVARMVMMGLEFRGEIPFRDVYIHSVVQAPDGRRMSKSLGTGIDPLEMIDRYGADATRFGLLLMSSIQDVRFSEEKIEMGRNFANKLWNASRLVLLAAESVGRGAGDGDEGPGSLVPTERSDAHVVDRWITARLADATHEVEEALASYEFSAAADSLYHFVWDEFCDWYLEMVKVRLYGDDPAEARRAAGHARWILDAIIRLLHPLLPFVTDEIADLSGDAPLLLQTRAEVERPRSAADDEAAVASLRGAAEALRRYRADRDVPPGETIEVVVEADDDGRADTYRAVADELAALCRTRLVFDETAPDGAGNVVMAPGATLTVLVSQADREAERARLRALLDKLDAEVARCESKLANEKFVARAPAAVVQKERDKLASYRTDRDEVAARLVDAS